MAEGPEDDGVLLAERLPEYTVFFLTGLAASFMLGLSLAMLGGRIDPVGAAMGIAGTPAWLASISFGALASPPAVSLMAYTIVGVSVVLLLTGGATGGGLTNIGVGAVGSLFGGHTRADDDFDDPDVRVGLPGRRDPRERLARGLRPKANPRAFWQVAAGLAYIGIAVAMLSTLT